MAINFSAETGFSEVVKHYNLWRKIANTSCRGSYDEPDVQNGRLYFRSDYSEKLKKWPEWAEQGDWGAWIIAPTNEGLYSVISSLTHERESERHERLSVLFSNFSDAGKYIIMRVGDGARVDLHLRTQFVKWDDRGLDPRISVQAANQETIDFFNERIPNLKEGFAKQHLKRYTFEDDPSSYGFAFSEDQPRMEVLALSFDELTSALLEDMPDSITSQAARWRE